MYICMSDNCTGLARSKVGALLVIYASLAVQSSPRSVTFSSTEIIVSGVCNVLDPVLLVCWSGLCTLYMENVFMWSDLQFRLCTQFIIVESLLLFVWEGFYCPEGTEETLTCPANTIRQTPGGSDVHDCLVCPPAHWCKEGKSRQDINNGERVSNLNQSWVDWFNKKNQTNQDFFFFLTQVTRSYTCVHQAIFVTA